MKILLFIILFPLLTFASIPDCKSLNIVIDNKKINADMNSCYVKNLHKCGDNHCRSTLYEYCMHKLAHEYTNKYFSLQKKCRSK